MKVSACGETSSETTLDEVSVTPQPPLNIHVLLCMSLEVLKIFIVVQRMISNCIVLLRARMHYGSIRMHEPRKIDAIFLGEQYFL